MRKTLRMALFVTRNRRIGWGKTEVFRRFFRICIDFIDFLKKFIEKIGENQIKISIKTRNFF